MSPQSDARRWSISHTLKVCAGTCACADPSPTVPAYTYRYIGRTWFRYTSQFDSRTIVSSSLDTSRETYGLHGNCDPRGNEYDAACACCFLGFSHSLESHLEHLRGAR